MIIMTILSGNTTERLSLSVGCRGQTDRRREAAHVQADPGCHIPTWPFYWGHDAQMVGAVYRMIIMTILSVNTTE